MHSCEKTKGFALGRCAPRQQVEPSGISPKSPLGLRRKRIERRHLKPATGQAVRAKVGSMALTRELRFRIKSDLLEAIEADSQQWSFRKVNLLLSEYNCEPIHDYSSDFGLGLLHG